MKRHLFKTGLAFVILVLVLHLLAYKFYWYASISWYDMLMHTLGGIFVAVLAGAMYASKLKNASIGKMVVTVLLFVIVIGFAWEIFEYIVQGFIKGVPIADIPDSISDLCCDTLGGILGSIFVIRAARRYNTTYEPVQEA